jgi:hypothetical protein
MILNLNQFSQLCNPETKEAVIADLSDVLTVDLMEPMLLLLYMLLKRLKKKLKEF